MLTCFGLDQVGYSYLFITHTTYSWNSGKNARAFLVCGFLMKLFKKNILKIWKKSWEPFGSYLLNSTANPAHFHPNWAGLAVLFSRQLLNGFHDFFHIFRILLLNDFIKNPQTRNTHAFLPLNISPVGSVRGNKSQYEFNLMCSSVSSVIKFLFYQVKLILAKNKHNQRKLFYFFKRHNARPTKNGHNYRK